MSLRKNRHRHSRLYDDEILESEIHVRLRGIWPYARTHSVLKHWEEKKGRVNKLAFMGVVVCGDFVIFADNWPAGNRYFAIWCWPRKINLASLTVSVISRFIFFIGLPVGSFYGVANSYFWFCLKILLLRVVNFVAELIDRVLGGYESRSEEWLSFG